MYYVYLLKWQGIPVYVGQTNDPCTRYKSHYSCMKSEVGNFVRHHLYYFNKTVDMELVFCTNQSLTALFTEYKVIRLLRDAGFALVNTYGLKSDSERIPAFGPIKGVRLRSIRKAIATIDILKEKTKAQYGYKHY
jgi:predicted GIY-YIG superfamily endonuclease